MNANRQGSLLDFIEDFTNRFPKLRRRVRDAADRQSHLEAAHRRHRRRVARARLGARLHRPDAARLGRRRGTCARSSRTRSTTGCSSTSRSAPTATATTAIWCASQEMRQSNSIVRQCIDWLRKNPGPVMVDNHKIAPPSRVAMKENMEELIHHFKLFTEGMHVPAGRGLCRGRASEGRIRRLHHLRRRQQAVPPEDPRPGLRAPRGARRDVARATCSPTSSRSSARRTSSSGR